MVVTDYQRERQLRSIFFPLAIAATLEQRQTQKIERNRQTEYREGLQNLRQACHSSAGPKA